MACSEVQLRCRFLFGYACQQILREHRKTGTGIFDGMQQFIVQLPLQHQAAHAAGAIHRKRKLVITPAAGHPCAQCPHRHTRNQDDFGGQIMLLIAQLTPTERKQMTALIDDILAKSQQAHQATAKQQGKNRKKR